MHQALIDAGWNPDQIHEVQEFDRDSLQAELDWLEENADENDIVFLYVTAHGEYLRQIIEWRDFFGKEWGQIHSDHRVLLVDSCTAADFTMAVFEDPEPHLSIAAVDGDEYGWKGLEEEGLPIVGGVFTFYFVEAFNDLAADADEDDLVSVQEAALFAEVRQREYMHEVVFAVPEFVEMYHYLNVDPENDPTFPDVIIDDAIGEPLYLDLDAYP
jgi:hypothetical protein